MGLRPIRLTDKSDDVYHDYVNMVGGLQFDATTIKWRLDSATTFTEYESWESYMVHGFAQCHKLDSAFGGHIEYVIAYRRVDTKMSSWCHEERSAKGITSETSCWEDFKQFMRTQFFEKSMESDKVVVPEV
jgi:hypothetical protein